jgi:tetraacyldisaccharide 4'-kinase
MRAPSFWYGASPGAATLGAILAPLGALYGAGAKFKNAKITAFRARAKVICVGNLTLGGTGKTPIAIALAARLKARGFNTVFLTRGYGGSLGGPIAVDPEKHTARDVGDEPLLLARSAAAIVSRDRAAGARLADEMGADVIIMDDGHQNFSLFKDLSLVVVDAETGFGNGRVFPAGPLRETVGEGLARADAVIRVGSGAPDFGAFKGPVFEVRFAPEDLSGFRGDKVVAFAGIGRPEKFFAMLEEMGADICEGRSFADHYAFTTGDLTGLRVLAAKFEAQLVTTEKDFVRIAPQDRTGIVPVPMRIAFADEAALDRLLDKLGSNSPNPAP